MLLAKGVDQKFWAEAVNTACYILNRTILEHIEITSPFEKWFQRKPTIKHLKIFGFFDPKSKRVIVVGYDGESTNYRL